MKPTVLILTGCYWPGHKAGGPIRSLLNVVDHLSADFAFRVLTPDREAGDDGPFPGVHPWEWEEAGPAEVMYLPRADLTPATLRRAIRQAPCDLYYMQGVFSPYFTVQPLWLRRLGQLPDRPIVLAPRGDLGSGALGLKSPKKRVYLALARALRLYDGITWQATKASEADEVRRLFGQRANVLLAPNLPPLGRVDAGSARQPKPPGRLRIAAVSRITRVKNILAAVAAFRDVRGAVEFDIYGPMEDAGYWSECREEAARLPGSVRVTHRGTLPNEDVPEVLAGYDAFLSPTLNENFGHAILEALLAGCPVVISDQTPWRGLEGEGVGWDLPLSEPERFRAAVQELVDMGPEEHAAMSRRARAYALRFCRDTDVVDRSRALFAAALAEAGRAPVAMGKGI